ncbi:carbonic anhydrase [Streptomyces sp. HNM0574]|uniref:carbonic anhydrase n=1 Tax=Streptomyces sp. HNM0574 TaxID=2714954 RepID=UPI001469ADE8|nr:carbonic anhydrase [Streptomyces sp. HNM0574]NLU70064.1 carbonic anhydrase [Streptomyces sp. HNM0574]
MMRALTRPAHTPSGRTVQPSRESNGSPRSGNPRVLFIGCSDFPLSAPFALGAEAHEVVEARTAGAVVPRYRMDADDEVGTTIEWALATMGVEEIVLCGHAGCAAVRSLWDDGESAAEQPSLKAWRGLAAPDPAHFDGAVPDDEDRVRAAERRHLLTQMHHLRTYPSVTRRLVTRRLRVHTWYHHGCDAKVQTWDAENRTFTDL